MENNINVSALAQNIADQCKQFEESEEYKDMIKNAVKKLYVRALDDVFSWGDFPNRVKEALKDAMPANVGDYVDLAKYNTLMINTLKESWAESGIQEHAVQQVQSVAIQTIEDMKVPEFVLMSELFESFIEDNADQAAEENWEKPNILCKERDSVHLKEYWEIAFEPDPNTGRYSRSKTYGFEFENCLSIRVIYTNRKDETIQTHDGHKCYELYTGKVSNDILGKNVIKAHSKFEKLMCALYFGNAYLVWDDVDLDDIYYPHGY